MRVLFVDYDPNALVEVGRMLTHEGTGWEMKFASQASEALDVASREEFDVIVSDLRMPDIDGISLLGQLRERQPQAARVVLSEHTDQSVAIRCAAVAHQLLAKPCRPADLRERIERASNIQNRISNPVLRSVFAGTNALPSPSSTIVALNATLSDPDVDLDKVAVLVEGDVAIAAKLLQLVNSSFFGLPRRVSTIREAVAYLGFNNIRGLLAAGEILDSLGNNGCEDGLLVAVQERASHVLTLAQRLAGGRTHQDSDLMVGALLHDIGIIALAALLPELWSQLMLEVDRGTPFDDAERSVVGVGHADIGSYLLSLWGLPYSVVEVVACHHRLPMAGQWANDAVHWVWLAHGLVVEVMPGPFAPAPLDQELDAACLYKELQTWRTQRDAVLKLTP
jgi:HD-like signal output (HDOD) protein